MERISFFLLLLLLTACTYQLPKETEQALKTPDANSSIIQLLEEYKTQGELEKYKALCYLTQAMPYHYSDISIDSYDSKIDSLVEESDAIYYQMVKGKSMADINSKEFYDLLGQIDKVHRDSVAKVAFAQPNVTYERFYDITRIDADFLRKHIDNAFLMRKKSPFAKQLSFNDFCRYILPYRAIEDYPVLMNGADLNRIFYKYLQTDKQKKSEDAIQYYNWTASRLRYFMGNNPFETNIGMNEMFFNGTQDCVDWVVYGVNALRACGIPAVAEYNVAYKLWKGRHYHISTLDSLGRWSTFSPESGLPKYRDKKFCEALNIYRIHFTKYKENPAHLKDKDEPIPQELSNPCIEDVTDNIMPTVKVKLPFDKKTKNSLAYLASFQSHRGMTAVTWGNINKLFGKVTFERVVPDNLYFPVYYNADGELEAFGNPFWIKSDSIQRKGYRIENLPANSGKRMNVNLMRKFPRKPNLLQLADSLVGVVVLASQTEDFSDADTLASITQTPIDYWQELNLHNTKAYKYYRIANKPSYPHLHIAELEFITSKHYNYTNTIPATQLPILPPTTDYTFDSEKVRIMDEPLEKCKWKAEYDQNVYTAPDRWPDVTLRLQKPQVVTHIRYIPKTANNAIVIGDEYRLMQWNGKEWQEVQTMIARQNYLPVKNIEVGKLYWLRNLTQGDEELPFYINEKGKQIFLHTDLLRILKSVK